MSIELKELTAEKERLEGDRKTLLERLQEYQQGLTQTQQQIQAIAGAIQTCNFFIGKIQSPQESENEKESSDDDS
jgi:chromosome segregation ATPase